MCPIIDLEKQSSQSLSDFHELRLSFNKAFLNEDYAKAAELCADAVPLCRGNDVLLEELSRFHTLLGNVAQALHCLSLVLEVSPANHKAALKKATLLRSSDSWTEYEAFIKDRIAEYPQQKQYYLDYAQYLKSRGEADALQQLIIDAGRHDLDLGDVLAEEDGSEASSFGFDKSSSSYNETDIASMLNLFSGRENTYARQWVTDGGRHGYTPVNEPLTPNIVSNHLAGNLTLGVYQLDLASKVKWILFDLDIAKSHLDNLHDPAFKKWIDAAQQKIVQELRQVLSTFHIPVNVEYSGYKGYHVWVFLESKITANMARIFAQHIASHIKLSDLPIKMELFPKQSRLGSKGLGNLVKLPYGIHRVSGNLSFMVDENFNPIAFEDFIKNPALTSLDTFANALASLDPGFTLDSTHLLQAEPKSQPEPYQSDSYLQPGFKEMTEPVPALEPDPENDLEWLWLKQNCHVLRKIDEQIKSEGRLTPAQIIGIKHSVGHLTSGVKIVNHLFRQCADIDPGEFLQSPLKGNAISCAKLRKSLEGSSEPCDCDFSSMPATYKTPILHINTLGNASSSAARLNEAKLKELISGFLELKKQFSEISAQLKQREAQIIKAFEESGVDHFDTAFGRMKISSENDQTSLTLELLNDKS